MTNLIPIGRFAQITHLSVKALRIYAQEGLLQPIYVDPESGYRYYTLAQATLAARIRLLRLVGFGALESLFRKPCVSDFLTGGDAALAPGLMRFFGPCVQYRRSHCGRGRHAGAKRHPLRLLFGADWNPFGGRSGTGAHPARPKRGRHRDVFGRMAIVLTRGRIAIA